MIRVGAGAGLHVHVGQCAHTRRRGLLLLLLLLLLAAMVVVVLCTPLQNSASAGLQNQRGVRVFPILFPVFCTVEGSRSRTRADERKRWQHGGVQIYKLLGHILARDLSPLQMLRLALPRLLPWDQRTPDRPGRPLAAGQLDSWIAQQKKSAAHMQYQRLREGGSKEQVTGHDRQRLSAGSSGSDWLTWQL